MNKELTREEAALLWAQKKRVQATYATNPGAWGDVVPIGSGEGAYWPTIFSKTKESYLFRLAPELPKKRYRPWTPDEVPVGALLKARSWAAGNTAIIASVWDGKLTYVAGYSGHMECPLGMACGLEWNYSTDQGKTWAICGVEVEA